MYNCRAGHKLFSGQVLEYLGQIPSKKPLNPLVLLFLGLPSPAEGHFDVILPKTSGPSQGMGLGKSSIQQDVCARIETHIDAPICLSTYYYIKTSV